MAKRSRQRGKGDAGARPDPCPPVPLCGIFGEFRDALRAEVEAAKRASTSGAVPLNNGRLLGTLGGGFQYQFDIESALDLPGDAPGELRLPNLDPVRVSVVAFEGLSVILNSEHDLGHFIPFATLQSNLAMLLLKLIERIEKKSTLTNPAGDRLIGNPRPQGDAERLTHEQLAPHGVPLNAEQRSAVGSVLGRDTTYIWGPPGTGKTHTIGAIGAELFRRGRSLLVVSHTNTAVDGAILAIGEAVRRTSPDDVENGLVVRVGTPKDARLKSTANAVFLLSEQRERRQTQLAEKRQLLLSEREPLYSRDRQLSLIIELHDWLAVAEPDMVRLKSGLERLEALGNEASVLSQKQQRLEKEFSEFQAHGENLKGAIWAAEHEELSRTRIQSCSKERDESTARLESTIQRLRTLQADLQHARDLEPHRIEHAKLPGLTTAKDTVSKLVKQETANRLVLATVERAHEDAERRLAETEGLNWITRKWKGLPDPEVQKSVVEDCSRKLEQARSAASESLKNRQRAEDTVRAIERLSAILTPVSPNAVVPSLTEANRRLDEETRQFELFRAQVDAAAKALNAAESERSAILQTLSEFRKVHRCEPQELLDQGRALEEQLEAVETARYERMKEERRTTDNLVSDLGRGLALLRELGLTAARPTTPAAMYAALVAGIEHAKLRAAAVLKDEAEHERQTIAGRVRAIASELESIEEALRKIEETVIREARVVGATLTASYLRDTIQNRRFDTVLLDEASMAAIPALWAAASLCDRSLVVVGDYRQLPPVVVSQDDLALKWLGRDPFQLVNLTHDGPKPDFFVGLREQHRMHPHVSAIANKLVYNGVLIDHPSTTSREADPIDWLSPDWPHHDPILLVDTGPLHAWVTPVSRGAGHASRLNFISATVCADIACRLLSSNRSQWDQSSDPRVLIISPYRPHSRLVSLLLKDDGITQEVVSGTVHSFQGSQADVVVLDLVNDEPHWKVGHFMAKTDSATARLFNVAITRAKRRLIVVGDFDYCEKLGKKAFLGGKFIPHLRAHHKMVSAIEVVPEGIATRAAGARRQVFGGSIKLEHDRTVVRQDHFYPLLAADLETATARVIIYSPFITQARMGEIETHLKAAVERGVAVVVVTKPIEQREKRERANYQTLENALAQWHVRVIHKRGMHEKLVLIDADIVWTGSLNPLSFRDTQEVMERRRSAEVFEEYAKTLMLQELLEEYSAGNPKCPICGGEVAAAEGGSTPFYWRCVDDACLFRRAIDDDTVKDGDVRCHNCGGDLKLQEKGTDGRARWVCTENPRHKQLVRAMHLKFAKVKERLSPSRLDRLERRFAAEAKKNGKALRKRADDSLFG